MLLFAICGIGNTSIHTHALAPPFSGIRYFVIITKRAADVNKILLPCNKSQEIFLNGDDNASFLFDWFRSQIWVIISGNRDWYIVMCRINICAH